MKWQTGTIDTDDASPAMRTKIENLAIAGMVVMPGGTVKIFPADDSSSVVESNAQDGFLICTTTKRPTKQFRNAFGEHCVQIVEPIKFARALQIAMLSVTSASFYAGMVDYSGRKYRGSEESQRLRLS